jgi:hypothetical protein|tara:strand:- start:283 stop:438 length:156 start_codon:yes stop_codon:yes gene_type:complete
MATTQRTRVRQGERARAGRIEVARWDIRKKVERSTEPTEKLSVAEKGTLNF